MNRRISLRKVARFQATGQASDILKRSSKRSQMNNDTALADDHLGYLYLPSCSLQSKPNLLLATATNTDNTLLKLALSFAAPTDLND